MNIKSELVNILNNFTEEQIYILVGKAVNDFKEYCFKTDKNGIYTFKKEVKRNVIDEEIYNKVKDFYSEGNAKYLEEVEAYKNSNPDKFISIPFVSIDIEEYNKFYKPDGNSEFNVLDLDEITPEGAFMAYKFFNLAKKENYKTNIGYKQQISPDYKEEYDKFLKDMKEKYNYKTISEMKAIAEKESNKTITETIVRISNKRVNNFESIPELALKYMEVYKMIIK